MDTGTPDNLGDELEFALVNRVVHATWAVLLLKEIRSGLSATHLDMFCAELVAAIKKDEGGEDAMMDVLAGWFSTARLLRDPQMAAALDRALAEHRATPRDAGPSVPTS